MYSSFAFLLPLAYLLGSIPFGKIVGNIRGVDIQKKGSGNIGFANALRVLGWKPAVFVLVGDVAKGYVPMALAVNYLSVHQTMAIALAALAGHIYPVWLRFKGGKGIATGLGITLAISLVLGLIGLAVCIIGVIIFRKSAAGSIMATGSVAIFSYFIANQYFWFYVLLFIFALYTHRTNIKHMLDARK